MTGRGFNEARHKRVGPHDGRFDNMNQHRIPHAATQEHDDAEPCEDGRITTLMGDITPLKKERSGRLPVIKPDDTEIQIQSKLSRYLESNLDGDPQQEAINALENLYGTHIHPMNVQDGVDEVLSEGHDTAKLGEELMPGSTARTVESHMGWVSRNISDKTGGQCFTLWDDDRRKMIFVSTGKSVASCKGERYFKDDDLRFTQTSLGDVLAASQVLTRMRENGPTSPDPMTLSLYKRANIQGSLLNRRKNSWDTEMLSPMYPAGQNYRHTVETMLETEQYDQMNRQYRERAEKGSSATVYEHKKQNDKKHVEAARTSRFNRSFRNIEIDDDVDLRILSEYEHEYDGYERLLPKQRVPATLRFRHTGRHHAIGMYHPGYMNIAVDPSSPGSFTHEYFHHLDHTLRKDGRQLSMSPDFLPIVRQYEATVDKSRMTGDKSRWLAPTEVYARAAELWMHDRAPHSSFLDSGDVYEKGFDYQPFKTMHSQVDAYFDREFGGGNA